MSAPVVHASSCVSPLGDRTPDPTNEALVEARVHLPATVSTELESGYLAQKQGAQRQDFSADQPLSPADLVYWFRVASLRAALWVKGIAVSAPDAHVAQRARDVGGELLTEDRVLRFMAGIGLCGWRAYSPQLRPRALRDKQALPHRGSLTSQRPKMQSQEAITGKPPLWQTREQCPYCRRYAIILQGAKHRGCIIAMRVPYPAANVNRIRRLDGISPNPPGIV